jgi:FMN phosphatase YigB (HAD superfamily)
MIKTIVFDFGNVIGFFDNSLSSKRLAAHTELSVEALHSYLIDSPLEVAFETGRLSTADFVREVRTACRLRCSEEVLIAAWADIFWPNHDTIALLPRLKPNYRLLLGSNTNALHMRQFTQQFAEALRYFDALVVSHEVGARKPAAAFFEHCQRLAGCTAAECLFIDDLPANVAGARACGWQALVYTSVSALQEQFAALGIRLGPEPATPLRLPDRHDL